MDVPFYEGPAETVWPQQEEAASTRRPWVGGATGWTAGQVGHDWILTVLVTEENMAQATSRRPTPEVR